MATRVTRALAILLTLGPSNTACSGEYHCNDGVPYPRGSMVGPFSYMVASRASTDAGATRLVANPLSEWLGYTVIENRTPVAIRLASGPGEYPDDVVFRFHVPAREGIHSLADVGAQVCERKYWSKPPANAADDAGDAHLADGDAGDGSPADDGGGTASPADATAASHEVCANVPGTIEFHPASASPDVTQPFFDAVVTFSPVEPSDAPSIRGSAVLRYAMVSFPTCGTSGGCGSVFGSGGGGALQ